MLAVHYPAAPLSSHVEMLWFGSREALPHSRERGLPSGRADIVIPLLQDDVLRFDGVDSLVPRRLRGAVVSGAHDRFVVRGTGGASSVIGVHFRPGGAAAFFSGSLRQLCNQTVLLEDLWGPAACELRDRLQAAPQIQQKFRVLEETLLSRLLAAQPIDAMVMRTLHALAQDPSVARIGDLQRAADCSPRPFIRRFEAAVGLTPKCYARVLRFNALLSRLVRVGPRDWAQLAVDGGYFDQSHLIHEFNRLTGLTPSAYVPVASDQPMHVAITDARGRALGCKNLQYTARQPG
jgi:AraC-like DNA-binding protein